MKLINKQNGHGWRAIIEDDESEERWSGNIAETEAQAREDAIDGFIEDKWKQVEELNQKARVIERSIDKLKKMKK